MPSEDLFEWRDVFFEYVGFLGSYLMLGAVGFRYGVLRGAPERGREALARPFGDAASGAAAIGLVGVLFTVVALVEDTYDRAEEKHEGLGAAFTAGGVLSIVEVALVVALAVAFVLAWRKVAAGWPVAAAVAVAFVLRSALKGRLGGMVNPLHVLGGSLWLGTLLVLVVCGLGQLLRSDVPTESREQGVAEMVRRFSALALGGAGLLGVTGLITGWNHLKPFAALWTTPYGYALLVKLVFVGVVLALGAWNWRRVGPALGHEGGGRIIRRTATTELAFAAIVFFVTAILVSLPSPKLPH